MPEGLNTYLYKDFNKKGIIISGGEAQKIAIARAIYKNAPFIILDEPTAALDPIAEAEIYEKFNEIITINFSHKCLPDSIYRNKASFLPYRLPVHVQPDDDRNRCPPPAAPVSTEPSPPFSGL